MDPETTREDLKRYNRMIGAMVKIAIDEAEINLGNAALKVIMLKCGSCEGLNQDSAKYSQECGAKLLEVSCYFHWDSMRFSSPSISVPS